jgi:hypothetical protein
VLSGAVSQLDTNPASIIEVARRHDATSVRIETEIET